MNRRKLSPTGSPILFRPPSPCLLDEGYRRVLASPPNPAYEAEENQIGAYW